jgi:hypothetical protein
MFYKNILQKCLTKMFYKNVLQKCFTKMFYKNVLQKFIYIYENWQLNAFFLKKTLLSKSENLREDNQTVRS